MLIRRGDIYYADLRPVVGSEQGGVRPVLVIQNDAGNRHSPTVIVAAITSRMNKAKLPTHVEVSAERYGIVKDLVGHGIGTVLHEDPQIPNYGPSGRGARLYTGMTVAIEPMVNAGDFKVTTKKDGWTVVTSDGSLSAHYENTIAITDGEPIVLTDAEN